MQTVEPTLQGKGGGGGSGGGEQQLYSRKNLVFHKIRGMILGYQQRRIRYYNQTNLLEMIIKVFSLKRLQRDD